MKDTVEFYAAFDVFMERPLDEQVAVLKPQVLTSVRSIPWHIAVIVLGRHCFLIVRADHEEHGHGDGAQARRCASRRGACRWWHGR